MDRPLHYPGYQFKVVDGLITNFISKGFLTLFGLCFGGREFILSAYKEAVEKRYRFYSYGDGMLIL
jgi:S-adenosylmethionine--tRNA ribosyltransferase-isomerase